jgi:small subunit ribosomal protein S20
LANTKSAEKRNRQDVKRREHNRTLRSKLKTAVKKVGGETDATAAAESYKETAAMLDRMATRGIIHRNKAARKKSQLSKAVKKLSSK